jgi:membrane protein implicated in regulation of membrane protease activity
MRPRPAAFFPVLAVLAAATLFLLVALSIALQPPTAMTGVPLAGLLAWARAVSFSGGAVAFLIGVAAFARAGREERGHAPEQEGESGGEAARTPVAPAWEEPMRYTLIALGRDAEDVRAIADFGDARAVLAAMRAWRARYPDEELRVFGPSGAEIARRSAATVPAAPPPDLLVRVRRPQSRLAAGGA